MIDFNQIDALFDISKEFIQSRLSDEQIFMYYFSQPFTLGKVYSSALRVDNSPSTSFYMSSSGKIIYHDHAQDKSYDCFDFVMELYKLPFQEAIKKIAHDFGIINDAKMGTAMSYKEKRSTIAFDKQFKKDKLFQFTLPEWDKKHLDYWKRYKFTEEEIRGDKYLYPLGELYINKRRIYNPDNDLWFIYVIRDCNYPFDKSKVFFKTYMPFNKEMKWLTNNPNTNPYGFLDLPYTTGTVIITKSRKDMMVVRKLWPDVMAVQNESEGALPANILSHLKKRYDRIIIWFDADETGVTNCTRLNKYGCGYINTPKELLSKKIKDPSDYVEKYDLDNLRDYTFNKLDLWKEYALLTGKAS